MTYRDREDAGERLAERLLEYDHTAEASMVMALSRGGVVVGDQIAHYLNIPLDFLVIKNIGFPGDHRYAMGAVDRDGSYVVNPATAQYVDRFTFEAERLKNIRAAANEKLYFSEHTLSPNVVGDTVILVDDGAHSGTSMLAAVELVRNKGAKEIIVALPVCSPEAMAVLNKEVEALVVDTVPVLFGALADYYHAFLPESDEKIKEILSSYISPYFSEQHT